MNNFSTIFNELSEVKTLELEKCNIELNNNHNDIIRKSLMVYRAELLECLEMYDHYLNYNKP